MTTSELTGAALDWAVAKCEGVINGDDLDIGFVLEGGYTPSTDWAQGGPIIEREKISVLHSTTVFPSHAWEASQTVAEDLSVCEFGPAPLTAAMRCYVASKLGDEVEIPQELLEVA